jgi:hypothetical protein
MPYPPFPSMYNPFLVAEPEYTVPPQLANQQTVYPQITGDIQAQLSDANRMTNVKKFGNVKIGGIDITQQPDPLYSSSNIGSQIKPLEYNQPNALQQRLANIPNIVKNIEDARSNFATYGDMNKEGVLLPKDISTPELDMLMGKAETPYVMDYVPFESEEEMLRQTNPPPDPLNPEPINIQTLDATGINNLAKNIPLPGAKQYPAFHGEYERMRQLSKDEAIVAEENKPKELPAFHGEYEKAKEQAKEQAKKEYWQNYKPIEIPFTPFKGQIPNDIDVENLAKDMPLPPGNTPTNPTNPTNPLVQTPKNKFGTPEAYYLGKSMLDATALINNMVQPQPPSIQMKLPHYERQRLNPEPYDTMRSEMRDQGTQAYRLQRENISQASDLMKGLAAVTSGTQQGLMQVGMQQAGAEQQIQGINQQISMQEQSAQTQILNQEATTNYQIQAQAQQFKDQMISAQLARLGDTAGAYAKYANMKEISTKQDMVNKAAIQSNNEIQNAMLQYQLQKDAMDSDEYKSSWSQHWNKRLDQMAIDKLSDQKYNLVKEYYGESTPRYGDYQRRAMDPVFVNDYYTKKNSADMFQKLYPGGVAPDRTKYTTDADYNAAVADFQRYQKDYNAYNTDKSYKTFEQEQDFWSAISNEKNEAAERKIFADTYMKDRGIFTSEQFMAAIQSSLERSRQSLEIGG